MGFLLRKVRKAKWYKNPNIDWLQDDELQADALVDLGTTNNCLSVWLVDGERTNLNTVVAALGASADHLSILDYALLDESRIGDLDIEIEEVLGETIDEKANQWHRDLIHLTSDRLSRLADVMNSDAKLDRCLDREVAKLITESITSGRIDRRQIKPDVLAKLSKLGFI